MTDEDKEILSLLLLYLKTVDTGFILAEVNEPERINNIISYIKENLKEKTVLSIDLQGISNNITHLGEVKRRVKDNPSCEVVLIHNLHTLHERLPNGNIGLLRDLNLCREPYANLNKLIVFFFPIFFVDLIYHHALDFLDWIPMKFKFPPEKSLFFERLNPEREFADQRFTRNRISYLESTLKQGGFDDKEKAERMFEIAEGYLDLYKHEKALKLFNECLELFRKIGDKKLEGYALNQIGMIYTGQAEYDKAFEYFKDGLNIFKKIGDREGEGFSFNNIGLIYDEKGDDENALKNYEQARAISKEIGVREGEFTTLNNIGAIYYNLGDYENALEYYNQAFAISKEIGNRKGEGVAYHNIGFIYDKKGSYENALKYYNQALAISKEIGNKEGEVKTFRSISSIYQEKGDYENSLRYLEQALAINREIGNKQGEKEILVNKSILLGNQNKIERAINVMEEAVRISKSLKLPSLEKDIKALKMLKTKKRTQ